ncbi:hypothetical protein [Prosthecomicrobium hirschii]|uniref:hypothetical protein n=1 Tax=Prosthecodimorpha hirschii TaxID=665126 RepID=UPI00221EEAEB|nr:hypothetical protein [Prosthecomicrobium hirschii]MCW1839477.1 hypothetical protein [Prosthecomicrobium hirschii]
MADRPILFSAPMVRAILAGTKTQTRRVLNPQPGWVRDGVMYWRGTATMIGAHRLRYSVGDRLWVREGFMPAPEEAPPETPRPTLWNIAYAAGGFCECTAPPDYDPMLYNYERWSPSIHMPRWASRLTLTVTDARVERLQDISEADAVDEGVLSLPPVHASGPSTERGCPPIGGSPVERYARLWDDINGPGAWDRNPWVAAYTFTVARRNINAVAAHA